MIASNADLPDIERLERQDFILDTEEHQQILAEEEKLIEGVKGEIEMVNLANMFLREQIKGECWDSMAVKGKTLKVQSEVTDWFHAHSYIHVYRHFETISK